MSLSCGSAPYYRDTIALGAFAAVEKGIFISCSAGNSGPTKVTLINVAPWIMTVGAGTLDRDFPAYAVLGNKIRYNGVSLYSGRGMGNKPVSLVYNKDNSSSNLCLPGLLDMASIRGKIVVCDRGTNTRVEKGAVVRDAEGVGMILANTPASGEELMADSHLLPAIAVGRKTGDLIREYARSHRKPTAKLVFDGIVFNVRPSPVVAAFSSRGPNMVTPQILKPDIIGPRVNILAAWSEAIGPTGLVKDTRRTKFDIMSGTSMSCPHISGLVALLKAAHPEWSPSAIKSALMTTAYTQDNSNSSLRDAADDPGELNHPSFSILFGDKRVVRYSRELTNVGPARSVYKVGVNAPSSFGISVRPQTLVFRHIREKKRYTLSFVAKRRRLMVRPEFGSIVWGNAQYQVKSPVSFAWRLL
ncbi:hypothetical protein GQ457_18G012860 [Hibiscus cannabinus]